MKYINPVYKRELKQTARMRRTVGLIFFYNALLALFGLYSFSVTFGRDAALIRGINYSNILVIYGIITGIEFALILFLVPALTAGTIAGERERQTLDILLTTKLTPLQIVIGKLMSSISTMILLAVSSLPIISIVFTIGGITLQDLGKFLILVVVTAVFVGSISIYISVCNKRTIAATVCSYSAMLVLVLGSVTLIFAISLLRELAKGGYYYDMNSLLAMCGRNFGNLVYFLLINPVFSFFAMLRDQTGYGSEQGYILIASGGLSRFLLDHWFAISLIVQLAISGLLVFLASLRLKPRRNKKSAKGSL